MLATLVTIAALGCSTSDRVPPVKVMPGALTKPIDQYTGDEFYSLVRGLSYTGGQERERSCKNDAACLGTKKTIVKVDAIATQDSIGLATMPQYGVVYVRAINMGNEEEARYGMRPNRGAYEYYMIVATDLTGKAMSWRLEELDTTPKARRHSNAGTGQFIGCNHSWVTGARADFKTCAEAASARDSTVQLGLALQGLGPPIWAECAMGCCVAQ